MDFQTRICKPGDETTLSLIAQATILETYAGIGNDTDLVKYATSTLTVRDSAQMLGDPIDFASGLRRHLVGIARWDMRLPSLMSTRNHFRRSN
jgi:hypothetical protein